MVNHSLCEGIPVLQPSRFSPCASGGDSFKAMRRLDIWKLCLVLSSQNLWFISVKKLATLGYVVGVFLPRIYLFIYLFLFYLFIYFFLVGQLTKVKPFRCPTNHYSKVIGSVALDSKGWKCRGDCFEEKCGV